MNLDTQLARLEEAQLVRRADEEERAYLFKHTLTQETAYESLLLKTRREMHRRVAESIERAYSDRLDEYAALLAQHYAQVGDDTKTFEFAARAGDLAARVYAGAEAVANYALAIQAAKRLLASAGLDTAHSPRALQALYLKRGRSFELLSHFDEAAQNYDEMEQAARELGDRRFLLSALIAQALIRSIPGSARNQQQALELSGQALGLARELGDREAEAKVLWIEMLSGLYSEGDAAETVAFGEQSLAIARELNLREQLAYTLNDLFIAYTYVGDMQKAREVRSDAMGIWREQDNKPMLAESISGLSLLDFLSGEFEQAISLGQESYRLSQSIGNLGGQGFSGYILALIYERRGEFESAVRFAQAAMPITEFGGLEGNGISPQAVLGWIYAQLGETRRAREMLESALRRPSANLVYQRLWLYAVLTRIELLVGHIPAAQAALSQGGEIPSPESSPIIFPAGAPMVYLAAAELALALRNFSGAIEQADSLLERFRKTGMRVFVPEASHIKAQALLASGRVEAALELWQVACAQAEAMGARRVLWPILLAWSQAEAARGNDDSARRLRGQAGKVVRYIAEHAPAELRESFLDQPTVRQVIRSEEPA